MAYNPASLERLIEQFARFNGIGRKGAARLGIREISQRGQNLLFFCEAPSMEKIVAMTQGMRGRVMFSGGQKPYFTVRPQKGQKPLDVIREVIGVLGGK